MEATGLARNDSGNDSAETFDAPHRDQRHTGIPCRFRESGRGIALSCRINDECTSIDDLSEQLAIPVSTCLRSCADRCSVRHDVRVRVVPAEVVCECPRFGYSCLVESLLPPHGVPSVDEVVINDTFDGDDNSQATS